MKKQIDIDGERFHFNVPWVENPFLSRKCLKDHLKAHPLKKSSQDLIPGLEKDLYFAWLRMHLFQAETMMWGRWAYWMEINLNGHLPDSPIPEIDFYRDEETFKHLENVLECIPVYGSWKSFGNSYKVMNYFLDWLLFAFGSSEQETLPPEPEGCEGASSRITQMFNLDMLIAYPYDYLGDLFVDINVGDNLGFCPTPMDVCELMSQIVGREESTTDIRGSKVYDPCLGTGRTFLIQSNYCLAGYAQEINPLCIKAANVNFFMYAPWYAAALPLEYLRPSSIANAPDSNNEDFGGINSFVESEDPKEAFADFLRGQYYSESNVLRPSEENSSLTFSVARHILRK